MHTRMTPLGADGVVALWNTTVELSGAAQKATLTPRTRKLAKEAGSTAEWLQHAGTVLRWMLLECDRVDARYCFSNWVGKTQQGTWEVVSLATSRAPQSLRYREWYGSEARPWHPMREPLDPIPPDMAPKHWMQFCRPLDRAKAWTELEATEQRRLLGLKFRLFKQGSGWIEESLQYGPYRSLAGQFGIDEAASMMAREPELETRG